MAFTQSDIDRLKRAIATGTKSCEIEGQTVTYRSLAEMRDILSMMERDVSGPSTQSRVSKIAFRGT
ncbi:hypothetical protein TH9_12240 [Thalassospira xiamenensis]|uniref:phage head-tail joining protein n=1 Tax=Thalassospira xiamenensis TaxID=220697 RepID=UPI000E0734B8|nr:hypothetical protein [Thalassospira xiamenensis]RCK32495.1 hypothetical protein TH9_12240 [Thalassospira xiamenensis]